MGVEPAYRLEVEYPTPYFSKYRCKVTAVPIRSKYKWVSEETESEMDDLALYDFLTDERLKLLNALRNLGDP